MLGGTCMEVEKPEAEGSEDGAGGEVEEVPRGRGHKTTRKPTKGGGRKKSSAGGGGGRKGMQMDISTMFAKCPQKRSAPEEISGGEEVESSSLEVEDGPKEPKRCKQENGGAQCDSCEGGSGEDSEKLTRKTAAKLAQESLSKPKEMEPPLRCKECRQFLDEPTLTMFIGDPENANEEFITLADPKLSLFTGEEEDVDMMDVNDIPQHKITDFTVYDKNMHLCPFDSGLVERNVELYFSGAVKPIYEENPDPSDGIPTKQLGPINSWWIAGFDGGEKALIGFTTAYAEYVLMEPSQAYHSIMATVHEKIYLSKVVIEFCEENPNGAYEDMLNKIETTVPPQSIGCTSFTEDTLLRHAQFIVEQVESYDQYGDSDEDLVLVTPATRALIKLAGVTLGKRRAARRAAREAKPKKPKHTMATTTPLVRNIFEQFFQNQIDGKATSAPKRRRCGVCEACQLSDCGKCASCRDMIKFGGTGRSKQACVHRRCPNMAVQVAEECEEDDIENDPDLKELKVKEQSKKIKSEKKIKTKVEWVGEPGRVEGKRRFFSKVLINNQHEVCVGDTVTVCPDAPDEPLYIARVCYMWEEGGERKMFHGQWFSRGSDTVLGEAGDPCELFAVDQCDDNPLGAIMDKVKSSALLLRTGQCLEARKGKKGHSTVSAVSETRPRGVPCAHRVRGKWRHTTATTSSLKTHRTMPEECPAKERGKAKGRARERAKEQRRALLLMVVVGKQPFRPLRSLDVFAGCGGLSEGFHQSGVAESVWAVEKEEPAAQAFRLNNTKATDFTDDCNVLLKLVMEGASTDDRGQQLPHKGEVELRCGGPPCQGFSGMNRFNSREYSQFKNSLVISYLSYCDYYRPRFFILENVRNFVSFKRNMVLKLTLRCLIKMGYQVDGAGQSWGGDDNQRLGVSV